MQQATGLRVANPFESARRTQQQVSWVALLVALLFHVGLLLVLPDELLLSDSVAVAMYDEPLEVEIVPMESILPDELKFVEANPEAPENEPDRKDQYSFRAQQAADEQLKAALLEAPNVDGEEDSQKIIQGAQSQAMPMAPGVYAPPAQLGEGGGTEGGLPGAAAPVRLPPAQPLPAPDFIQQQPLVEDGPGSRLEAVGVGKEIVEQPDSEAPIHLYQPQPTAQTAPDAVGEGNGGMPDVKPMPRARPTLSPDLVHGPLMRSEGGTNRRGSLAIDATFSEFGEYEQQFYTALQAGWYQEIDFFQPIDTSVRVVVGFRITADGVIHDVEVRHSTAGSIATLICQTALTKRSPFRPWTREMVQVFGEERVLQVVFHYR